MKPGIYTSPDGRTFKIESGYAAEQTDHGTWKRVNPYWTEGQVRGERSGHSSYVAPLAFGACGGY